MGVIWAVGDGDGSQNAKNVANLIVSNGLDSFDKFLYLGDVYDTGSSAEWATWLNAYGVIPETQRRHTPGNHEYPNRAISGGYNQRVPSSVPGGKYYYAFNHVAGGVTWRIIVCNSQESVATSSAQYSFLTGELAAPGTAKVVVWHRPRYSESSNNHGDNGDMAAFYDACSGKALVVLGGHDHNMQLFNPINGIRQVVIGCGGHALYPNPSKTRLEFENSTAYGALRMTFAEAALTLDFINTGGTVLKSKTLTASVGSTTTPTTPTTPTSPTSPTAPGGTTLAASIIMDGSFNNGTRGYMGFGVGTESDTREVLGARNLVIGDGGAGGFPPALIAGERIGKFTIFADDGFGPNTTSGQRAEVRWGQSANVAVKMGEVVYEGHAVYVPTGLPIPPNINGSTGGSGHAIAMQWHDQPADSPNIALNYRYDIMDMKYVNPQPTSAGAWRLPNGTPGRRKFSTPGWHVFVWWVLAGDAGFVQLWHKGPGDAALTVAHVKTTMDTSDGGWYPKWGIYTGNKDNTTRTLYYTGIRVVRGNSATDQTFNQAAFDLANPLTRVAGGGGTTTTPTDPGTPAPPPPAVVTPGTASPADVDQPATKTGFYARAESQLARTDAGYRPSGNATTWPHLGLGATGWATVAARHWAAGFMAGLCWKMFERTGAVTWKDRAEAWQAGPIAETAWSTHDLGFLFLSTAVQSFRLTGNTTARDNALAAAVTLDGRFNATVGAHKAFDFGTYSTIFNTIIDEAPGMELLFWSAKNGGPTIHYTHAVSALNKLITGHVRADGSTFHVAEWGTTGTPSATTTAQHTHQGYSDASTWARGQAWGIYGFTMGYRETRTTSPTDAATFLSTAVRMANYFVNNLPTDGMPWWDFQAPTTQREKDTSAAAIAAAALMELANYDTSRNWRAFGRNLIGLLTNSDYLAEETEALGIFLHGVSNRPANTGVNVPTIYGDYFGVEAFDRYYAAPAPEALTSVPGVTLDVDFVDMNDVELDPARTIGSPTAVSGGARLNVDANNRVEKFGTRPVTGTGYKMVAAGDMATINAGTGDLVDYFLLTVQSGTSARIQRHRNNISGNVDAIECTLVENGISAPISSFALRDANGAAVTANADLAAARAFAFGLVSDGRTLNYLYSTDWTEAGRATATWKLITTKAFSSAVFASQPVVFERVLHLTSGTGTATAATVERMYGEPGASETPGGTSTGTDVTVARTFTGTTDYLAFNLPAAAVASRKYYGVVNTVGWGGEAQAKSILGNNADRMELPDSELDVHLPTLAANDQYYVFLHNDGDTGMTVLDQSANKTAYANELARVVTKYGQGGTFWSTRQSIAGYYVEDFEIQNEPYGWWSRGGDNSAAAYARIASAAITAGKAANPNAKFYVAMANTGQGASGQDYLKSNGTWGHWGAEMLAAVPGLFSQADGFTMHGYNNSVPAIASALDSLKTWAWAQTGGNNKPFLITEMNLSDQAVNPGGETAFVNAQSALVNIIRDRPWVKGGFVFNWRGYGLPGSPQIEQLGYLTQDGVVRQARADAFKAAVLAAGTTAPVTFVGTIRHLNDTGPDAIAGFMRNDGTAGKYVRHDVSTHATNPSHVRFFDTAIASTARGGGAALPNNVFGHYFVSQDTSGNVFASTCVPSRSPMWQHSPVDGPYSVGPVISGANARYIIGANTLTAAGLTWAGEQVVEGWTMKAMTQAEREACVGTDGKLSLAALQDRMTVGLTAPLTDKWSLYLLNQAAVTTAVADLNTAGARNEVARSGTTVTTGLTTLVATTGGGGGGTVTPPTGTSVVTPADLAVVAAIVDPGDATKARISLTWATQTADSFVVQRFDPAEFGTGGEWVQIAAPTTVPTAGSPLVISGQPQGTVAVRVFARVGGTTSSPSPEVTYTVDPPAPTTDTVLSPMSTPTLTRPVARRAGVIEFAVRAPAATESIDEYHVYLQKRTATGATTGAEFLAFVGPGVPSGSDIILTVTNATITAAGGGATLDDTARYSYEIYAYRTEGP